MNSAVYHSPIGALTVIAENGALTGIIFGEEEIIGNNTNEDAVLADCVMQLNEYFYGERKDFDLPIAVKGTVFQRKCWDVITLIPFGDVRSYKDIAEAIGNIRAVRAVGGANHRNPLPVIIPCHRVIGANGSLTGYAGEVWRKQWLLEHEKRCK